MTLLQAIRLWWCLNAPWHKVRTKTIGDSMDLMICSCGRTHRVDHNELDGKTNRATSIEAGQPLQAPGAGCPDLPKSQ